MESKTWNKNTPHTFSLWHCLSGKAWLHVLYKNVHVKEKKTPDAKHPTLFPWYSVCSYANGSLLSLAISASSRFGVYSCVRIYIHDWADVWIQPPPSHRKGISQNPVLFKFRTMRKIWRNFITKSYEKEKKPRKTGNTTGFLAEGCRALFVTGGLFVCSVLLHYQWRALAGAPRSP